MAAGPEVAGHVVGMLSVIYVTAASAVAVVAIVSLLVLRIALRAIEKSPSDQVPQVIIALGSLIGSFRWIWPWYRREWRALGKDTGIGHVQEEEDEV